jgi:hypothetical protein
MSPRTVATIKIADPKAGSRAIELVYIAHALFLAGRAIRAARGSATRGAIRTAGKTLGSFEYRPKAQFDDGAVA